MSEEQKPQVDLLDPKIREKLTTENIYKILNQFIIPLISEKEKEFLFELQDFLIKEVKPKINLKEPVYGLFKHLGKVNLMQRLNPHNMRRVGFRYEMLLAICLSIIDPELDMARVVSGIIFSNPIFHHGRDKSNLRKVFESVITGEKIGCICITEREHGSDAVRACSRLFYSVRCR
jgi:alkylation response protein AidB-like acyl-CoA dehydrogenase